MWQIELIKYSFKKREKTTILRKWLHDCENNKCLDLGSARGTISFVLRQYGGTWVSADMDWINVLSTRELVSKNVVQINDIMLPFKNETFDKVVSLDFLEHIHEDECCIREIARILKPGGMLIISTPATDNKLFLNKIKPKLGLTMQTYGHVREGYTSNGLASLLEHAGFLITKIEYYSRTVTEAIEMILNSLYVKLQKNKTNKRDGYIAPATQNDYKKFSVSLKIFKAIYPVIWGFSRLDFFLKAFGAYAFVIEAEKKSGQ